MPAKRFLLIANPCSGVASRENLAEARRLFAAQNAELEVLCTERSCHATELGRDCALDGFDGVCVLGGDGTIHELIAGLMARPRPLDVPLGLLPGGTGNSTQLHLGIAGLRHAVERIVAGRVQSLDVMKTRMGDVTTHCVNLVGWGAVAYISQLAERLRWIGRPRYSVAALAHILTAHRRPAALTIDGERQDDAFLLIIGCNTKYVGLGMKLAPRASHEDGLLDLVLVRKASRRQMLELFRRVFDGSHLELPFVEYRQARSFRIETAATEPINLDGDVVGTTPVDVEVVPAALKVFA